MRRLVFLAFLLPACSPGHLTIEDGTDEGVAGDTDLVDTDAASETDGGTDVPDTDAGDTDAGDTADTDAPPPPPDCGDGHVQGGRGETCDDGNTRSGDGCSSTCQSEYCGDGVTQAGLGEACDDGNATSDDGCTDHCVVEFCGDGVTQAGLGEVCDDGNPVDDDGCDTSCQITNGGPDCGNGQRDGVEVCDDGNHKDGDGCNASCLLERFRFVVVDAQVADHKPSGADWDRFTLTAPDPYVTGTVGRQGVFQTGTDWEETEPEWNEDFRITVLTVQALAVKILDDDSLGGSEAMCTRSFSFTELNGWVGQGTQTISVSASCPQFRFAVQRP